MFSTPGMAAHCVADDWQSFLNTDLLYAISDNDNDTAANTRTYHCLYSPMVNGVGKRKRRRCIYPHRSPLVAEEHAYFTRCVDRLRHVASDPSARPLLVIVQSSRHRSSHAAWAKPVVALFAALEARWNARFELIAIRLQRLHGRATQPQPLSYCGDHYYDYDCNLDESPLAPNCDERFQNVPAARDFGGKISRQRGNVLRVVYLDCVGGDDGSRFVEQCDHDAFCSTIQAGREFALRVDQFATACGEVAAGSPAGDSSPTMDLERRRLRDPEADEAKVKAKERRRAAFEAAGGAARFKKSVATRSQAEHRAQKNDLD